MGVYIKADPFKKIFGKELVPEIKKRVQVEAYNLLRELDTSFLLVSAIPAPDPQFTGHKIRQVDNRNPKWYQEIWAELDVKRDRIISSLKRVAKGSPSNMSSYDYMFIEMIKDRLLEGYDDNEIGIEPDNKVRVLMGLSPIDIPEEIEDPLESNEMF